MLYSATSLFVSLSFLNATVQLLFQNSELTYLATCETLVDLSQRVVTVELLKFVHTFRQLFGLMLMPEDKHWYLPNSSILQRLLPLPLNDSNQHDASECFLRVVDNLTEAGFFQQGAAVHVDLTATLKRKVRCHSCNEVVSETDQSYTLVDLAMGAKFADGELSVECLLDSFLEDEVLCGQNLDDPIFQCGRCNKRVLATKSQSFEGPLPQSLYLALNRFERIGTGTAFQKKLAGVKINETLVVRGIKGRLSSEFPLTPHRGKFPDRSSVGQPLNHRAVHISPHENEGQVAVDEAWQWAQTTKSTTPSSVGVASPSADATKLVEYFPYAVIFHLGATLNFGHYVTLSKSNRASGRFSSDGWYLYNDDTVTKVPASAVNMMLSGKPITLSGKPITPYIVAYQQMDSVDGNKNVSDVSNDEVDERLEGDSKNAEDENGGEGDVDDDDDDDDDGGSQKDSPFDPRKNVTGCGGSANSAYLIMELNQVGAGVGEKIQEISDRCQEVTSNPHGMF